MGDKKIVDDQINQEKKLEERRKFRQELRDERRDELFAKLEKVRLEGVTGAGSTDVRSKIKGIKRTIEKGKPRTKATKALLKAAKQQGIIRNVKDARRIIEGKKKAETKPDGR